MNSICLWCPKQANIQLSRLYFCVFMHLFSIFQAKLYLWLETFAQSFFGIKWNSVISLKWNGTQTAHPETERTWRSSWVYLFYYLWSRGDLAFIFLIKRPFISFFMLPWEPLWGPADRPERGDVNWPWPEKGRQTDGIPELSDSLNRPQQRYLFHCFCTFSFRAQWKINMKRPENRQIETEWVILPQQTCWQVKITAWVTLQLSPLHKPAL